MFDAIDATELIDFINSSMKYDKVHNCYMIKSTEIIDEINNQTRKRCANCFRYDGHSWRSRSGVERKANEFCAAWVPKKELSKGD